MSSTDKSTRRVALLDEFYKKSSDGTALKAIKSATRAQTD